MYKDLSWFIVIPGGERRIWSIKNYHCSQWCAPLSLWRLRRSSARSSADFPLTIGILLKVLMLQIAMLKPYHHSIKPRWTWQTQWSLYSSCLFRASILPSWQLLIKKNSGALPFFGHSTHTRTKNGPTKVLLAALGLEASVVNVPCQVSSTKMLVASGNKNASSNNKPTTRILTLPQWLSRLKFCYGLQDQTTYWTGRSGSYHSCLHVILY